MTLGMNPKDVVSCIEGKPFISVVLVVPGLTNMEIKPPGDGSENGQWIIGMNTENAKIRDHGKRVQYSVRR